MAAAGMFGGLFDEAVRMGKNSGVYRRMNSPRYGRMLFNRTVGGIKGIPVGSMGTNVAGYMNRMGGMGLAMSGEYSKMWGMNALKGAGINAAIGGVYGGMTDQYNPWGGAVRGAATGVAFGAAGRGALYAGSRWGGAYRNRANAMYSKGLGKLYGMGRK